MAPLAGQCSSKQMNDLQLFEYRYTVPAPLRAVSYFHHDSRILQKLMPPPIFVRVHQFEPLQEGSTAVFTFWIGPLPVRWHSLHDKVSLNGFRDTQVEGPFASWQHTHQFTAVSQQTTAVYERIEYRHHLGIRGVFSRLLFNRPALWLMFNGRKWLMRYHLRRQLAQD